MKRGAPLRADPAKTREWQQRSRDRQLERARGREGMLSSFLRAATAPGDFRDDDGQLRPSPAAPLPLSTLKRAARKATVKVPKGERAKALRRTKGLCCVCLHDATRRGLMRESCCRATQLHHVLPKRMWPEFAKLAANLVGVCPACHANHESAHRRIPLAALHQGVIDLAREHGIDWYIEKTYPT